MKRTRIRRSTLKEALRCISAASVITTTTAQSQEVVSEQTNVLSGKTFSTFLSDLESSSPAERDSMIDALIASLSTAGGPIIQDSVVTFVYFGEAKKVTVPSDFNAWDPSADRMSRLRGTSFFHFTKRTDPAARFEYKLVVDSVWILDPLNSRKAFGGYGANSEVWMPEYKPEGRIIPRENVPRGKLDTLLFKSSLLGRSRPVYVYVPPAYEEGRRKFSSIWVTDGGEYLSLGLMNTIMDNLLADGLIDPVIGVFMDPRTDPRDAATSTRMYDYAMSDTFLTAVLTELRENILKRYRVSDDPARTAIMGASFGGLISTYASLRYPDVFGLCAAQSPSYSWDNGAIFSYLLQQEKKPIRFYIDTGTINDAQPGSVRMKDLLRERGYPVRYGEYPEGHNWVNWRARIDEILTYFFGQEE